MQVSSAPIQLSLFEHEREIEQALERADQAWQVIAEHLRDIHDQNLYRQYGTWGQYCRERWGKRKSWGYYLVEAARLIDNVHPGGQSSQVPLPTSEKQIRPLAALVSAEQAPAWRESVERFGPEPTNKQVAQVVKERREVLPPPVVHEPALVAYKPPPEVPVAPPIYLTSQTDEWYTPPEIMAGVRELLGTIDLDPASSERANATVQASAYYTAADDGLAQSWVGKVFLNPPYSAVSQWTANLVAEYVAGRVTEAVALVAARVDTLWWQLLAPYPVCFIRGRLKFSGAADSATFPSAVLYLGPHIDRFWDVFQGVGPIYTLMTDKEITRARL